MKKLLVLIFICLSVKTFAQKDLTLHFMPSVEQAGYTNPAFVTDSKFTIGIPFLTSNSLSFVNNGFTYNDVIKKRADDSLYIDTQGMLAQLKDKNYLSTELSLDIISSNFRIKSYYLGFNVTEKVSFRFGYSKEFMEFLLLGNGEFIGSNIDLEGTSLDAIYYREYGISAARNYGKFFCGVQLKYLTGLFNVWTERNNISLYTDPEDYELTAQTDFRVNTSGVTQAEDASISDMLLNQDNKGLALDIGSTYKINDKWSASVSILDLGFILWKSNLESYFSKNASLSYSGIDMNNFASSDSGISFDAIIDTLDSQFQIEESEDPYTTYLTPKTYLSATYAIDDKSSAGALIYSEFFQGIKPAFTLSYNRRFGDIFNMGLSYSIMNSTYLNFGLGASLKLRSAELYFISDNATSLFFVESANAFNLRFGLNFLFGRPKKDKTPKTDIKSS